MKQIKIYHILSHTLEDFIPELKDDYSQIIHSSHTVNKFIAALMQHDMHNKFEHILCIPSRTSKTYTEYKHESWYNIKVFPSFQMWFFFQYSWWLIRFIQKIDDGIVHVYWTGSLLYDFISPILATKKSIAHYMGWHFTWKNFLIWSIKYGIIQRFTLTYPRKLFIQNKYRIEKYHSTYKIPYSKMLFAPVALEEKDYINKIEFQDAIITILFVWRLEKAKWVIELLDVFEKLHHIYPNTILKIAWTWSLESYIRHKVSDSIHYLWQLNYTDLNRLYPKTDIFTLPTHFDCFPSVLLEAWISGLPVVSTRVEWPLSIIKDWYNWFLIQAKNNNQLFHKLEELIIDSNLRKRLWQNARNHVLENFTWTKVADTYFKTYQQLWEDN